MNSVTNFSIVKLHVQCKCTQRLENALFKEEKKTMICVLL